MPDFIRDAPELLPGLELYFNAFLALTTCRVNGFGIGQIPWTAVNEYCLTHGIEGEDSEDVQFIIRRMDEEYVKLLAPKKGKQ